MFCLIYLLPRAVFNVTCFELTIGSTTKTCVSLVYRHPLSSVAFEEFSDVVGQLVGFNHSNYVFIVDFNINFADPSHFMTSDRLDVSSKWFTHLHITIL